MGLKGSFSITFSTKTSLPVASFFLKNDSWFGKEHIDAMLIDAYHQKQMPMSFDVKSGDTVVVNVDTTGWDWAVGDTFNILKNNKIKTTWQCDFKDKGKRCPSCHGSKVCSACKGEGFTMDPYYNVKSCSHCGGTGVCVTCYVPRRDPSMSYGPGRAAQIRAQIHSLETQLLHIKETLLPYELRKEYNMFYSQMKMKQTELEVKIQQLYRDLANAL